MKKTYISPEVKVYEILGCHISNAFIEGKEELGGIVGENKGIVSDCLVN